MEIDRTAPLEDEGARAGLAAHEFDRGWLAAHLADERRKASLLGEIREAIFGAQDEKVFVEIAPGRLAPLGLDLNQVLMQLGQQNAVESGGTITAPSDSIQVRVAGPAELEQLLQEISDRLED